jgi:hypothetical protein
MSVEFEAGTKLPNEETSLLENSELALEIKTAPPRY